MNKLLLLFSACQIKILYLVSKSLQSQDVFAENKRASSLKYLTVKSTVPIMQISGVA